MARKFVTDFRGDLPMTPDDKLFIKNEPLTPRDEDFVDHNNYSFEENDNHQMRRSLSMGDIATIKEELVDFQFEENEGNNLSRLRKQSCAPELSRTKFVSMAEAIYRYQRDTPDRFHTGKPKTFVGQRHSVLSLTRPQSPMLRCKNRARIQHILSQKEKEELEVEEIRKYQIKAHPVPKSVIEGGYLPEIQRKPNTVPEPFNLTEVHKRLPASPENLTNFKARPAPRHILENPPNNLLTIPKKTVTKPVSPKFHYKGSTLADNKKNLKNKENQPNSNKVVKHVGPVKPEPFSFEKRDEELKRRREERIKRQLEEERMLASQFKAQPLPVAVKSRMQAATTKSSASSTSSENKENHVKFEAKPPVVLYKKPFKPVLQGTQIVQPKPFDLATQKRAAEREHFDKLLKEKEAEIEKLNQQRQKEQQEEDEKALAELRANLVHHAKPVPSLEPRLPGKIYIPLTMPETPKLVRRLRKQ
ncbi:targeting protein for Xklp2 homolog [Bicyclus anynana]|uniref:Targeting protein for Xklp2 homolog n=1 Tax=Bicyclus anynana TaxID=110368 RepID=A0A6J1N6V8_BICAN|nr:targeting protein for Xklp2 homolog [Bicyclus anynana]